MSGRRKVQHTLSVLTAALVLLCGFHLKDEMWVIADLESLTVFLVLWLLGPLLNFLIGFKSKSEETLGTSAFVAFYYFLWMLFYALDETSMDKVGDQNMHLLFAPFVMAMLLPVALYIEFGARRIWNWLRQRSTGVPS